MRGEDGMREHDDIEAALAAALRPTDVDDASARAAVAAFRTARDTGLHSPRPTRRREDWRPAPERRTGRSLKTALAALVASLTLGGIALATAVPHDPSDETETRDPEPRRTASAPPPLEGPASSMSSEFPHPPPPSSSPSPSPSSSASPRPAPATHPLPHVPVHPAPTHESLCRAYEKALGNGKAMDAPAWERLVAAADGEDIPTYCESLLPPGAPPASGKGHPDPPAKGHSDTHATPKAGDSVRHPHAPAGDAAVGDAPASDAPAVGRRGH
ncbi:hypothetical protein ABT034_15815 [Streptomyces sp. NPDC002773]|uniref:hypothetical protein n=1 Tax=Streptomyces sp. NPDC002773 TaxID=3154430 RepID=UPI00332CC72A